MLKRTVILKWLLALDFKQIDDVWVHDLQWGSVYVNLERGLIEYPSGLTIHSKTTCNLSQLENLVVLDCVLRLLRDNYPPESITLEPTWKLGHGSKGGRADVLVRDRLDAPYLLIECKTFGFEFEKEWKKTTQGKGQLFSYAQQETDVRFLALFASEPSMDKIRSEYRLISHVDDETILAKDSELQSYRNARSVDERFQAWSETYDQHASTSGLFSGRGIPYEIGKIPLTVKQLTGLSERDRTRKSGEFATILRKYNISGRENAFDILVNLFLSKLADELYNSDDLQFVWRGSAVETPYNLVERLEVLYRRGMMEFLSEEVAFIASSDLDQALRFIKSTPDAAKQEIADLFKRQKFFSKSNFGFVDVHNEELFLLNSAVLIEMVDMWQSSRLSVAGNESSTQALGDMFEIFLDQGIKQNEGQYFTPWPVCDFIIDCVPEPSAGELPRVLDFACGAGHFITQYFNKRVAPISDENRRNIATSRLVGVEKEYRLSKVARVATAMYGAMKANIEYKDSLATQTFSEEKEKFDLVISNPPYSVEGFLTQLDKSSRDELSVASVASNYHSFDQIEDAFLEKATQVLKPGGHAALIFPESFYDRDNAASNLTRELLFRQFKLRALVKLPSGSFSSTGTTTWIAFLEKRMEGPLESKHIDSRVEAIFSLGMEAIADSAYSDEEIVERYLDRFGMSMEDLLALIGGDKAYPYEDGHAFWMNDPSQMEVDEFIEKETAAQMDRLRKFWLLETNGNCLFVTPVEGAKKSDVHTYLGYKWSRRKGHAGLHLLNPAELRETAPLFPGSYNKLAPAVTAALTGTLSPEQLEEVSRFYSGKAMVDLRPGDELVSWPSGSSPLAIDLSPVVDISSSSRYPVSTIEEILEIEYGRGLPEDMRSNSGDTTVFGSPGPVGQHDAALFSEPGVVVGRKGTAGSASLSMGPSYPIDTTYFVRPKPGVDLSVEFLYLAIDHHKFAGGGSGVPSLSRSRLVRYQIPIPPRDVQERLVQTVFNQEGSNREDAFDVNRRKDPNFRNMLLAEELGW